MAWEVTTTPDPRACSLRVLPALDSRAASEVSAAAEAATPRRACGWVTRREGERGMPPTCRAHAGETRRGSAATRRGNAARGSAWGAMGRRAGSAPSPPRRPRGSPSRAREPRTQRRGASRREARARPGACDDGRHPRRHHHAGRARTDERTDRRINAARVVWRADSQRTRACRYDGARARGTWGPTRCPAERT